jgi:hypothetical protein
MAIFFYFQRSKPNPHAMKLFSTLISCLLLTAITTVLIGCGEDGPSTPAEQTQLNKLAGIWSLQTASLAAGSGSEDWSEDFDNATLTLAGTFSVGGTYTYAFAVPTTPSNSPWPEDGNWKFKGTTGTDLTSKIIRLDDGVEMSYVLTATQLTLTFPYSGDGFPDGRVSSVEGNWTFVFTK